MSDPRKEMTAMPQQTLMQTPKKGGLNVFSDPNGFAVAFNMASCLAESTIVPREYQRNVGNCMIAIEMASRIDTSPMMVMQNLYIVNGRPAWSSQWIVAMINSSKRYKTELQFEFGYDRDDGGLSCRAWAEDYSGHKVCGPKITMNMARAEGWVDKNGSKWKTMPEVMIQYRAASFFGRMNCPDMIMGIYSADEAYEIEDDNGAPSGEYNLNVDPATGKTDVDRIINKQERESLFDMVAANFGVEEGNAILKALINDEGYESTSKLTKSAYDRVVVNINQIVEARKTMETVTGENVEPAPEMAAQE